MPPCMNCKAELVTNARFCQKCGTPTPPKCPKCGQEMVQGSMWVDTHGGGPFQTTVNGPFWSNGCLVRGKLIEGFRCKNCRYLEFYAKP